jgi:hypothetical protein
MGDWKNGFDKLGFWTGGLAGELVKKIRQVARKFEMWLVFL